MNDSILKQIQKIEKEMLDAFVSICEKENLHYYLYAGTALGAVRHKGFIPWDDDIDVCMPRKDYDRFIVIANKYLKDNIRLLHFTIDKNCPDYCAKLIDTNIILNVKRKNIIEKHNVWIDVFPLDGTPNNRLMRFFHYKKLNMYRWMYKIHYIDMYDVHSKRSIGKNIVILIAKIIPIGKLINPIKIYNCIDKQLKKQDYNDSIMLGSFLANLREKEMVPRWCYDDGRKITFEDSIYIAPKRVEDYLTFTYGDYMKLPPIEDRKPEHHNIVSLEIK